METREPMDATMRISTEPDFLQGGVTERRIREESDRYTSILQGFALRMERERAAIDREFIRRTLAIAQDPFAVLDRPEAQLQEEPEPHL